VETHDIVIAGGGSVGLMLACGLRRYGVDVLVLERLVEPSDMITAGSVNGRSVQVLERIGLGSAIAAAQREAVERMQAFLAKRAAAGQPAGGAS
jgi:2-polyprenyl-6-methoxyphenol hydroxylase-like FAD-dependent oxidoreductase